MLEDWLVDGHCRHFVSPMLAVMQVETCMKKRAPGEELAEVRASAKKRVPCPEVPSTVVMTVLLLSKEAVHHAGSCGIAATMESRVAWCVERSRPAARAVHLSVVRTISSRSSDRTPGRCLVRMARREAPRSR